MLTGVDFFYCLFLSNRKIFNQSLRRLTQSQYCNLVNVLLIISFIISLFHYHYFKNPGKNSSTNVLNQKKDVLNINVNQDPLKGFSIDYKPIQSSLLELNSSMYWGEK
jgi:hypothetical protein